MAKHSVQNINNFKGFYTIYPNNGNNVVFYSKHHRISHKTPKGFRLFNIYKNLLARYLLQETRIASDIEPKLFRIFAPSKQKTELLEHDQPVYT